MYITLCIEWCMGAIYMCAFTSIYLQIPELYGNDGLLPAHLQLKKLYGNDGLLPAHLQLKISCNDKHEKCYFWASHGECENNPTWMKKNCKLSCRACTQKDHAVDNFREKPTILWFSPLLGLDTELGMDLCCLAGVVLSLTVLIMPVMCNKIVFVLLWLLYFSLYQVGQTFLWFQWDILLLEAGFLTILLARTFPSSSLTLRCYDNIVLWLFRWLLFRLMFASGVVKLTSKCPTWWSLTALDWHYESQCIPTPLAWYAHQLPQWFQKLSVVATFVIEIPLPFLFFAPIRNLRLFSFYCQVLLQGMIVLTGNYNFFNLLTILLCISLLDDQFLDTSFQCKSPNEEKSVEKQSKFSSYITSAISIFTYLSLAYWTKKLFALGIKNGSITSDLAFNKNDFFKAVTVATKFGIGIGVTTFFWEIVKSFKCLIASNETRMKKMWSLLKFAVVMVTAGWVLVISMVPYTDHDSDHSQQDLWSVVHKWYLPSRPYHVVNSYGLFRRMTGVGGRTEIIIEGSNDLKHWKEFEFFYKPGDPATPPSFVAPHQPRIDWQMWFAALGNYQHNPWFVHLIYKLLHSNQSYVASPFSEPPVYVRSTLYIYRYTSLGNHGNRWWKRDKVREYTPPLTKDEPSLQKFIENMGWAQKEQVKSRGALSRLLRFSRRHFETYNPTSLIMQLFLFSIVTIFLKSKFYW